MSCVLAVAPHPDDETLGCGGALLRHRAEGDDVHWLIVTCIDASLGYNSNQIEKRQKEIEQVAKRYDMTAVHETRFATTTLDSISLGVIVGRFAEIIRSIAPEVMYVPYRGDVHTDHRIVFDAASSCAKWFRNRAIRRVLAYETLSETEFSLRTDDTGFRPNYFVDISAYIDSKIEILKVYSGELGAFPFPRSEAAVRALAAYRGTTAGFEAAEAFMLLRQVVG